MEKIESGPGSQSFRISAILLAAGKGTRMASPLPKVLHPVAGQPMIYRLINEIKKAGLSETRVVVGYGDNLVRQVVEPLGAICFKQGEQKGTGDAVRAAEPESLEGLVLILNGDHPLIEAKDLKNIIDEFKASDFDLAVVTSVLKSPKSFGRIVRHKGELHSIVEAKDASHETLKINEVNTGIYIATAESLSTYLPLIENKNAQGEYYLTDIISLMKEKGKKVGAIKAPKKVCFGVNSQMELAKATQIFYRKKAKALMDAGVVLLDPLATYVEENVEVGPATVIYPGVVIKGNTKIGAYSLIEPNCCIFDSVIEEGVIIKAMSHLEKCIIKEKAEIGPYARIRPETEVGREAKVGNFVELKKVKFGNHSKASHLTYLGDAEIGENVNIGCGTITCNYAVDKKKYKTIIEDDCFIGSDSQFVAPVKVGKGSVVGSGSTITKDIPEGSLGVARAKQVVIENYKPKK